MKSLGCPMPVREKRTVRITTNLEETVAEALYRLMQQEGATASTVIQRALKRDPSVQIVLRQITSMEARN